MKKWILLPLMVALCLNLSVSKAYGENVEEIREKMIAAQGGKEKLKSIKDSTVSGAMQMPSMGMQGAVTIYQKEPDKMRMDIELMGTMVTTAYDGKTAWAINPETGEAKEMPEKAANDFKRQALGTDALLNPKKYGIKHAFKGKEEIDGKNYLVLEQSFADDFKATHYVDAKTYLVYKTRSKSTNMNDVEVETESVMTDYKKVEGIMVAHSITIYQDGQEFIKITINEVSYNTDLEDSLFKMEE